MTPKKVATWVNRNGPTWMVQSLRQPISMQSTRRKRLRCRLLASIRAGGVTKRAVVLGALLIPFNAFWIVRLERVLFGPYPSTISLFANVVFVLFVLLGLNGLCRWIAPRWAFSQGELLTLYTMLAISTGLAGLDGVGILSQIMPHGAWFGATNHWTSFLNAFPELAGRTGS